MLGNSSDDDILDMYNPKLLIEDDEPIKIHLEGFKTVESLKLLNIVEKHGGKLSGKPGPDVVILSPPQYRPKTQADRFHIDWLYKSISLNAVEKILQYRLEFPSTNIKQEVEKSHHQPKEPINVRSQQEKHAGDGHSLREPIIKIPRVSSLPQKHAWSNIIDGNPIRKDTSEMQRTPKYRRRSQSPIHTIDDSPGENKSSKNKGHLYTTSSQLSSPTVSSSRVELTASDIKLEVEEEDDRHVQQRNVGLQPEKNTNDYNNVRDHTIETSKVVPLPQTNVSIDVNENAAPEDISEIHTTPKRRRCSQMPVLTRCELSKEDESPALKYSHYSHDEEKAMVQYLIDNDAFKVSGGVKIWEKMREDGMMRHRTAGALFMHFYRSLRHRIRDFTSDEEVIKKIEVQNNKLKSRRKRRRSSD